MGLAHRAKELLQVVASPQVRASSHISQAVVAQGECDVQDRHHSGSTGVNSAHSICLELRRRI